LSSPFVRRPSVHISHANLLLRNHWANCNQTLKIFFIFHPPFFILSLTAILVGSRDHLTQIWKEATQGPFHQSLVAIGPVVSEEKIKMWNVDGRTKSDDNSSHENLLVWNHLLNKN
jgi:K+-transporting ATPase A subunit